MTTAERSDSHGRALGGFSKRKWVGAYIVFWVLVALSLSLSSLTQYVENGSGHYWEPFLWESSSTIVVALLAILVYRLVVHLDRASCRGWRLIAIHALAACGFAAAHIAGTYAIRASVYWASGQPYRAGSVSYVLSFESLKDLVTYAFLAGVSYGFVYFIRERARAEEVAALQAEVSAARLALLQSQLNPHFLFNTLNLISSVLRASPDLADVIIERLATLLRATLRVGEKPTHSLIEELAVLRPYLDIMTARFGDRLHLEVGIDAGLLEREIPTLMLMPIVENAIQHGVSKAPGRSVITIAAEDLAPGLRLTVSNDTGVLEADSREGGIGLTNTRERLWRLYRDTASIAIVARPGGGAAVSIALPGVPRAPAKE